MKIPVARLSKADQEFLEGGSNPFEELDESDMRAATASASPTFQAPSATSATTVGDNDTNANSDWSQPHLINWDDVPELERSFGSESNFSPVASNELTFEPKKASLPKKLNFFEDIRRLEVNPTSKRAVVGYTVSFSVPKPLSRISLLDLPTGKAINSLPVEADMCPLCVLNDGTTIVMYGTGRDGMETSEQIQLWKLNGKKVIRTATWIPFSEESESFGKKNNAAVAAAFPLIDNKAILLSDKGHLVCFDIFKRRPLWHSRLSGNFAVDLSLDGSQLYVMDGHTIMQVDPLTGEVKASTMMEGKPHLAWPRIKLSPSGKRLLISFTTSLRVLDLTTGKWIYDITFAQNGGIGARGLSYPHEDFALLDESLLVHLPTQIKLCSYQGAQKIVSAGNSTFIGLLSNEGGMVVPSKIPHPKAESTLKQAEKDPSVFLIHPGVEVSINAAGVGGQYQQEVTKFLTNQATAAGYKVVPNAPISIVATVSGPTREAISFIARGSYVINKYESSIRIVWKGKDLWKTSGTNAPGMLATDPGQTIQEKLDELGKSPSLYVFEKATFPKLLQQPNENAQDANISQDALLTSKFTMQGLVDSN